MLLYKKSQLFSLNEYEKEKKVIALHLAGKTTREISIEVHRSFRDISRIIKTYDRKKEFTS
jgi:hypothetical protein